MPTHSNILARKILWKEEPGGLQSMDLQKLDATEHAHIKLYYTYFSPSILNLSLNQGFSEKNVNLLLLTF